MLIHSAESEQALVRRQAPFDIPVVRAAQLTLTDIISIEPEIADLLLLARQVSPRAKNFWWRFETIKRFLQEHVGWHAKNKRLRSPEAYEIVMNEMFIRLKQQPLRRRAQ